MMVPKKGTETEWFDHGTISLLSHVAIAFLKIIHKIIYNKLEMPYLDHVALDEIMYESVYIFLHLVETLEISE